jgi:tetratricopeptide (TPR) repeat protein
MDEKLAQRTRRRQKQVATSVEERIEVPTTSEQRDFINAVKKARERLAGENVGLDRLHDHLFVIIEKFRKHAEQLKKKGLWGQANRDLRYLGFDARKFRKYEQEVEEFANEFILSREFAKEERSHLEELKRRIHIEAAQNLLDFSMYEGRIRELLLYAQALLKEKKIDKALEKLQKAAEVLAAEKEWLAALSNDLNEARELVEKHRELYWQKTENIEATLEGLKGDKLHHYLLAIFTKPHLFPAHTVDAVEKWLATVDLSKKQLIQVAEVYLEIGQLDKAGDLFFRAKQFKKARDSYAKSGNFKKQAEALTRLKCVEEAVQVCLEHHDYEEIAKIYQEAGNEFSHLIFKFKDTLKLGDEEEVLGLIEAAKKSKRYDMLAVYYYLVSSGDLFKGIDLQTKMISDGFQAVQKAIDESQFEHLSKKELLVYHSNLKVNLIRSYFGNPNGIPDDLVVFLTEEDCREIAGYFSEEAKYWGRGQDEAAKWKDYFEKKGWWYMSWVVCSAYSSRARSKDLNWWKGCSSNALQKSGLDKEKCWELVPRRHQFHQAPPVKYP